MTSPDATGEVRATVEVDYGQWYMFDPEARADDGFSIFDPLDDALLWEHRCASQGPAAVVYTEKQYGPTEVVARVHAAAPSLDDTADHVAELSLLIRSGRLALTGWDSTVIIEVLQVPTVPLRARLGWYGLEAQATTDDSAAGHFTVDLYPGPKGPVEVLRWWPAWIPPPHETTTEAGLRRFVGPTAAEALQAMEWIPLLFWSPYPEMVDLTVQSLYRDPHDDSRWAHGSGPGSHRVLLELTADEFTALEGQGFPSVRTYAIDADGRVWTSDIMPLERVPCLNLVPRWQFEMVKGFEGGLVGVNVIDLPDGWGRIYRLPPDGQGPRMEVTSIDDADGSRYQRWRDDGPPPP